MLHPQRFYNVVVLHEHLQAKISGPVPFLPFIPWEKPSNLAKTSWKKNKNCGLPQVWFLQAVISIFVLVCKSKNLGSTQTLHCSGNWHRWTPRDELNLIRKVRQQPKPATKELVMVFEASSTNTLLNLQMITSLLK